MSEVLVKAAGDYVDHSAVLQSVPHPLRFRLFRGAGDVPPSINTEES